MQIAELASLATALAAVRDELAAAQQQAAYLASAVRAAAQQATHTIDGLRPLRSRKSCVERAITAKSSSRGDSRDDLCRAKQRLDELAGQQARLERCLPNLATVAVQRAQHAQQAQRQVLALGLEVIQPCTEDLKEPGRPRPPAESMAPGQQQEYNLLEVERAVYLSSSRRSGRARPGLQPAPAPALNSRSRPSTLRSRPTRSRVTCCAKKLLASHAQAVV